MPSPLNAVQMPYNWWADRKGHTIEAIIAHNTVGIDSRSYLSRGGERSDGSDRKVSIHILIQKDGAVYRYVPDERGANHAGFGTMPSGFTQVNPNLTTLGFELENARPNTPNDPYTDAQLLAMGAVILAWRQRWGNLPILRHATLDPDRRSDTVGLSVPEIEQWVKKAAGGPSAPPSSAFQHYLISHPRGARLREKPTTQQSATLLLLSQGTPIVGTEMTDGTETVEGEPRWVKTTVQHKSGFIWRGLLEVAP
jgi:hypothetical protein